MGEDDGYNEEYKIDDPVDDAFDEMAHRKKKEMAKDIKATELICSKSFIEADSVFQVADLFEKRDTCVLLPSVRCDKAHCTSCNVPMLFSSKSRMMLECVWQSEVRRHVDKLNGVLGNQNTESLLVIFNKAYKGEKDERTDD